MELAKKEKKIRHLQSKIEESNKLFKEKLLKMKGGASYDKWKAKHDEDLNEKRAILENMKEVLNSLDDYLDQDRIQFERGNIKQQIGELQNELNEMKISQ